MSKIGILIATTFFYANAYAQVDPKIHKKCLAAADYKGCVQMMSSPKGVSSESTLVSNLKNALRLLPDRLENTSLREFGQNVQIFSDAFSLASAGKAEFKNDYENELLNQALYIKRMVDSLQSYWSARIHNGTYYGTSGYRSYYCSVLKPRLADFNQWAGSKYQVYYNGVVSHNWLLGKDEKCSPQESQMIASIKRRVEDALIDPDTRKAEIAKRKRDSELAAMEPWIRHLELNPGLKKWAESNPKAAKVEKEKFLKKYNADKSSQNIYIDKIIRNTNWGYDGQ